jgi:hypothetical protein
VPRAWRALELTGQTSGEPAPRQRAPVVPEGATNLGLFWQYAEGGSDIAFTFEYSARGLGSDPPPAQRQPPARLPRTISSERFVGRFDGVSLWMIAVGRLLLVDSPCLHSREFAIASRRSYPPKGSEKARVIPLLRLHLLTCRSAARWICGALLPLGILLAAMPSSATGQQKCEIDEAQRLFGQQPRPTATVDKG